MDYRHGYSTGRFVKDSGDYVNIAETIDGATNDFGEIRTALRYPQLTLNAGLPLSTRRDYIENSQNGGGVELVDGEYRIFATSATDSVGSLITRQRANYLSGAVLEGGIGARLPTVPLGNGKINWGFIDYDRSTAIQFSSQSSGTRLQVITGGATQLDKPQNEWNIDPLDGTGPSGLTLDMATGHVSQIPLVYYGYGDIVFQIMATINGKKRLISIHRVSRDGQISIDKANLPLGIEVFSDGEDLDAYVGGRQINSSFPDTIRPRLTSGRRLAQTIGTSFVPLVSFRHKTGFKDIFCTLHSMEIDADADLIVEIRRNGTLTDDTFNYLGNYTESERALQYDITATAISGGECIYDTFVITDKNNQSTLRAIDVPDKYLSEFDTISLVARTESGSATAKTIVRNQEKW